ncbi:MAG: CoA synthetase, partial [Gammaproteobacteria bacterium]|nr:CoA synthetase [Gammaproteobacteria bacterium]
GTNSPVAATAALLVEAESEGGTRASILGSRRYNPFNDGGSEIHDRAAQGRIDAFFLGGGQIDGQGNINLVGTGSYSELNVRFPGGYGSAFLYFLIPRVILFREEHSRRVLVPRVDFVSAPGTSPPSVHRTGGPHALVTRLCVMAFDRDAGGFRLQSLHPGVELDEVRDATGFDFDIPEDVPQTPPPEPGRLELIRGGVREQVAETYPEFAETRIGGA